MEEHILRNAYLASIISSPLGGTLVTRHAVRDDNPAPPSAPQGVFEELAAQVGAETETLHYEELSAQSEPPVPKKQRKYWFEKTYRRYRTNIRTDAKIGGNMDSRVAQIQYEVGSRFNTPGQALAALAEDAPRINTAYPTAPVLAEDFLGLAKKYTNFSATFHYSSLAGLVERVAKTLACTTAFQTGHWDSTAIRAGQPLFVAALGTLDGPVNSLANTVFIPRLVDNVLAPDTFTVLANAAAGEGSRVVTDVLEIDATTRQPMIPVVNASSLAQPCVDALRVLGANMSAAEQGPLFALALVRGLNSVLSLVGHTDEGGTMRDLLRVSGFDSPFGGIHYGLQPYAGIPSIATNHTGDAGAFTDGILIASAALVAHCDPGVEYGDQWYPTVLNGTTSATGDARPGDHQDGDAQMAARNRGQLALAVPRFAELYGRGLGKLFAAEGDVRRVQNVLSATSRMLDAGNRHLRLPSVAPFFWVEPTGLLPPNFLGTPAEENDCASLAFRGEERSRAAWSDITPAAPGDTSYSTYTAVMPFARSAWFFNHWLNHPANGLGAIQVRQLDPSGIIHPGPCEADPQVRDRVESARPFTDFLWRRGQSPFPAPAELINLGRTVGFAVRHMTMDEDGIPTEEHVPTLREFADTTVTMQVGRLSGLRNGQHNAFDSNVRRARTRAVRELSAACARTRVFGQAGVAEMPVLTTAPTMRGPAPPKTNEDATGGVGRTVKHTPGPHTTALDRTPDRQASGPALNPVQHNDSQKGPQIRGAGGGLLAGGGGGAVPPPPPQEPPADLGPVNTQQGPPQPNEGQNE